MTSKERVLAVFDNKIPDRVPMWHGLSTEFIAKAILEAGLRDEEALRVRMRDDFRRITAPYILPDEPLPEGVVSRTVFGVDRMGQGYGQPSGHFLEDADLNAVHQFSWPDPECVDISTLRDQANPWQDQYAILGGDWSPFWHDAIDLLGMENLYIKMYEEPQLVHTVLDYIVDFYVKSNQRILEEAHDLIDILFIGNDFGSQTGPLMSPDLFEEFLFSHLKRLSDLGHEYGVKVQLHCCGGVFQLIPLFIKAGVDALHALQPDCLGMDLKQIKQTYQGKIVLNGAIDSHHILINGTPSSVRQDVQNILKIMMENGGYIAGASHDWVLEETPVENMLAMVDAVKEFGVY